MESSKEQLIYQLTTSAVALLSKHNVPQSEMYGWIKDALKKHVDGQPPVKVLYNNCYGGYTLSKPFKEFLCDKYDFTTLKDERTKAVQYIAPFACHLLDSGLHPGLREILYLYHYHDFGNIMTQVKKVIQLEKEKLNVLLNIENIRNYLEDPASKYKEDTTATSSGHNTSQLSLWMLKVPVQHLILARHTKQHLEEQLAEYEKGGFSKEMIDTLTQTIKQLVSTLGQELYDEIDRFVEQEQKNELGTIKYTHSEWWAIDEKNKFSSFISLLNKNGYTNDVVWRYQKFYDKHAIKFLLSTYASQQDITDINDKQTVYDFVFKKHIPLTQDVINKVEETFGLLCASGSCCKMAIATVPPLLEWSVGDYDGLENVYVV